MEIIKGYCCHSKEVCSWPSFLSLLSKVNRLNWTARITKRGAFLAWIPPQKKFLCSLLYSQFWIFQDWCLGRALWLKTLHLTTLCVPSVLQAVTAGDESGSTCRLSAGTSSCWQCDSEMLEPTWHTGGCRAQHCDIDTEHSYRARAASAQTAFPGMAPWMASQGTGNSSASLTSSWTAAFCCSIKPALIVAIISSPAS